MALPVYIVVPAHVEAPYMGDAPLGQQTFQILYAFQNGCLVGITDVEINPRPAALGNGVQPAVDPNAVAGKKGRAMAAYGTEDLPVHQAQAQGPRTPSGDTAHSPIARPGAQAVTVFQPGEGLLHQDSVEIGLGGQVPGGFPGHESHKGGQAPGWDKTVGRFVQAQVVPLAVGVTLPVQEKE